jgi:hypothetical protein
VTTETALAPIEGATSLSPAEHVIQVRDRAKAVYSIIMDAGAYREFEEGKKYLQVEAWQVIGSFDNVHAQTDWVRPVEHDGEVVAYEARVNLISTVDGSIRGGAQMSCGIDEFVTRGKQGWGKTTAAESMAQTRAESKAFRMCYSAVALLAGFQPTPAEEMDGSPKPSARGVATPHKGQPSHDSYFCMEHDAAWFQRGRMRGFAHPIKDAEGNETRQWCNMPTDDDGPVIEPMSPQEPQGGPRLVVPAQGEDAILPLGHPGQFMEAVQARWGAEQLKGMDEVCTALGTETLISLPSLTDAWQQLVEIWG